MIPRNTILLPIPKKIQVQSFLKCLPFMMAIIDFKYNINSGLKVYLSPLFEGRDENPNLDFLMILTAC